MNLYYFYITFIAIIVYIIWSDPNGPRWLDLQFRLLEVNIRRWLLKQKLKRGMPPEMKKIIREMERKQKNDKNQM